MPSEVRHRVATDQAFPLVRLAGVLSADTAAETRSALLDVLAGQPEAVVVDVADLDLADPAAAGTLRDLREETADWPAARLALSDPHDAGRWRDTGWPVWPSPSAALDSLGDPNRDDRLALTLEPAVGAARRSRETITEACERWDRSDLAGSACIVVTEMVNNVVAHARTSMVVLLAVRNGGLAVAVRDESPRVPSFTGAPAPTAYGGRGTLLIDTVATRWGSLPLAHGKVVWALLGPGKDGDDGDDRQNMR
ncbi:ATP-binding protein [Actinoplanes sp. NPDC051411]|uniref:ATP-binding protein n=1 Tax=Actinoplanes sp. NPDC051411 TaxID=3155522 RepID=UPI003421A042